MPRQDLKKIPGARKTALPDFIAPQLATLVKDPPPGNDWLHELKFDGYRMLCRVDRGKVRFWSRNGKDWTEKFLNVAEAVKSLPVKSAIPRWRDRRGGRAGSIKLSKAPTGNG